MKRLLTVALLCLVLSGSFFAADTGRMWENLNLTALLSPEISLTVMPGHRWEFSRDVGATSDTYFNELFIGPTYTTKLDPSVKFKLSLWYYYMGFPSKTTGAYPFSHNIEVIPAVDWKVSDRLTISDRLIFHNTFFASTYATEAQQNGLSIMIREMVTLTYNLPEIDPKLNLIIADEVFIGIMEDSGTTPSGAGFYRSGFNSNRLYLGFSYAIDPTLIIVPQYVYETTYNNASILTGNNHNFYLTVTYLLKMF
ncbi:MAG: DUF2490 domain-containing protein [Candidatus Firestonebacteria bacterium]